jgi:hypothetical protein
MKTDIENAVKAEQAASLLVQDLRDLIKTDNALLNVMAVDALTEAVVLQHKIVVITEGLQTNEAQS